jgi:tRNA pseudouridine32 synthase
LNPTMALVEVPPGLPPLEEKQPMVAPPAVITSPCDPWPRPYFLENGLRRVAPYHYTYNTYCKQRWRGRELLDIFASEFRDRPEEYYVSVVTFKWC